jgi:hypothetical protein
MATAKKKAPAPAKKPAAKKAAAAPKKKPAPVKIVDEAVAAPAPAPAPAVTQPAPWERAPKKKSWLKRLFRR